MEIRELAVAVADLPSLQLQSVLRKRSGAFPHKWHDRLVCIACNLLVIYSSSSDNKPKKVVALDRAVIEEVADGKYKGVEHALKIKSSAGQEVILACPSAEDRVTWLTALRGSSYERLVTGYNQLRTASTEVLALLHEAGVVSSSGSGAAGAGAGAAAAAEPAPTSQFMAQELLEGVRAALLRPAGPPKDTAELELEVERLRAQVGATDDSAPGAVPGAETDSAKLHAALMAAQSKNASLGAELARARERLAAAQRVAANAGAPGAGSQVTDEGEPAAPVPGAQSAEEAYEHEWAPFQAQAASLERAGQYADAEQAYLSVLEVRRERCGPESMPVAATCRDIGRVAALQKAFSRAEKYYQRAADLTRKLQGLAHPNTACALTDLAAVLREQGKLDEAYEAANTTVQCLREGIGPHDVATGTALYNLAGLAKRRGDLDGARRRYKEALDIFTMRLGKGAGETADAIYQMACLSRKQNDWLTASREFGEAADAYTAAYGDADRRVAEATKKQRAMLEKITSP